MIEWASGNKSMLAVHCGGQSVRKPRVSYWGIIIIIITIAKQTSVIFLLYEADLYLYFEYNLENNVNGSNDLRNSLAKQTAVTELREI